MTILALAPIFFFVAALTGAINQAYLDKYNFGSNAVYAQGVIEQAHVEKTMEFILRE